MRQFFMIRKAIPKVFWTIPPGRVFSKIPLKKPVPSHPGSRPGSRPAGLDGTRDRRNPGPITTKLTLDSTLMQVLSIFRQTDGGNPKMTVWFGLWQWGWRLLLWCLILFVFILMYLWVASELIGTKFGRIKRLRKDLLVWHWHMVNISKILAKIVSFLHYWHSNLHNEDNFHLILYFLLFHFFLFILFYFILILFVFILFSFSLFSFILYSIFFSSYFYHIFVYFT